MKKLLLSVFALMSLTVQAMVEQTAVFDFTDLYSLTATPPLTQAEINKVTNVEAGVGLNVSNRSFSEGLVTLLFPVIPSSGAGLAHYGTAFSLDIGPLTSIKFAVSDGCLLQSIIFSNSLGILNVSAGQMNANRKVWEANGDAVSEVTIKVGNNHYEQSTITVNYLRPSTPLDFLSSSPSAGSNVEGPFQTMTLSFSSAAVKTNNASSILLTGQDVDNTAINQVMNVTSLGSTVTLTAPNPISKDATLKVNVPAGTFENSEGATNSAIEVPFTLIGKRDLFNPVDIEPAAGTYNELPRQIRLTFDNFVKIGEGIVKFKQQDGSGNFPANVAIDSENAKVAIISHTNGKVVDASSWIVEIPAGVFHNQYYQVDNVEDRWNAALNLSYIVDGSGAGPQDTQTMKDAKALLKLTGVGYPKTTDPAWVALNALVTAEETPTDEALLAAMTNLYNATDVQMPEDGGWYNISGVNKSGQTLYLGYDAESDKMKLVTKQSATAFKVTQSTGNVIVFETKDGRFLHVPSALPNYGKTSTGSNLTDEQSDLNNLTLTKFNAVDVTETEIAPSELFGKLTIQGKLDQNEDDGSTPTVYARFSYDGEGRISTTASQVPLAFTDAKSNAFVLTETTEPGTSTETIYPRIVFRPAVIAQAGETMLLEVRGPASTTVANPSLIYYTKSTSGPDNNQRVEFSGTILTPTDDPNAFSVNTVGLPAGEYNIVLEEGALAYTAPQGKTIKAQGVLTAIFTIQGGGTPPSGDTVIPTATLSKTQFKAGDVLVLKIGNVGKATIKTPTAPYYEYADGEDAGTNVTFSGTILTSKSNTTADFNVNTTGLSPGKYKLVMPSETFLFEAAQEGQTVQNIQLIVSFEILNDGGGSGDDTFRYTYDAYITFLPASIHRTGGAFKDIDLNEMYLYSDNSMADGLVANPEKTVYCFQVHGGIVASGHFENYPNFAQEFSQYLGDLTGVTAIKFIPDVPIQEGDLDNWAGYYSYYCEAGAFGDINYGKWLNNHSSVNPEDCRVNPVVSAGNIYVNNARVPTGIDNVTSAAGSNDIYDLQGRRIQNMDKKGVYIVNGRKFVKK